MIAFLGLIISLPLLGGQIAPCSSSTVSSSLSPPSWQGSDKGRCAFHGAAFVGTLGRRKGALTCKREKNTIPRPYCRPSGFSKVINDERSVLRTEPSFFHSLIETSFNSVAGTDINEDVESTYSSPLSRLSEASLNELNNKGYAIIENFIDEQLIQDLKDDVQMLRDAGRFKIAGVGQDSSNAIADDIRRAETCFIDNPAIKHRDLESKARWRLYQILYQARDDLSSRFNVKLDPKLDELLYAFYPRGGYYRRHVDSVINSPSYLRSFSFLLYLNDIDWDVQAKGGALRLHLDSGKDECPSDEEPNFVDVSPKGGTMVVFQSFKIPHEVLDTTNERLAVVGWYNRAMTPSDIVNITPADGNDGDLTKRVAMLAVGAALVTVGLVQIITSL